MSRWHVASFVTGAMLTLAAAAPAPVVSEAPAGALRIEVRARELVPGEPLRIVVESPLSLARVDGSFLDRNLAFVREKTLEGGERWLAWGVVPLGRGAGRELLEISARASDGVPSHASRTLEIRAKRFPTQQLDVESKFVTPPTEVEARIANERKQLAAIYTTTTVPAPATHPFTRPIAGEPTSTFGARRIFNGVPRDPHPGLDLRAGTGTPVLASGAGRVALAGDLYFSGGTVIVDHGGGLFTVYAHLSRIDVREGDELYAGKKVGLSGATGRVTGPHLHWGAKIGEIPFDPRALLDPRLFR